MSAAYPLGIWLSALASSGFSVHSIGQRFMLAVLPFENLTEIQTRSTSATG